MKRILIKMREVGFKAEVLQDTFYRDSNGVLVEHKISVESDTVEGMSELCYRYREYAIIWCFADGKTEMIRCAK